MKRWGLQFTHLAASDKEKAGLDFCVTRVFGMICWICKSDLDLDWSGIGAAKVSNNLKSFFHCKGNIIFKQRKEWKLSIHKYKWFFTHVIKKKWHHLLTAIPCVTPFLFELRWIWKVEWHEMSRHPKSEIEEIEALPVFRSQGRYIQISSLF